MVQTPVEPDAVKSPEPEIDPQEDAQVTGIFAVNCCVAFCGVLAVCGVMAMGEVTVTEAEAAAPPAVGVAVTVQAPATSGATYRPEPETDPQEALHVALALAVNCFESPSLRVALVGEMVMLPFPTPERATF